MFVFMCSVYHGVFRGSARAVRAAGGAQLGAIDAIEDMRAATPQIAANAARSRSWKHAHITCGRTRGNAGPNRINGQKYLVHPGIPGKPTSGTG
jgi:hypothetical protein